MSDETALAGVAWPRARTLYPTAAFWAAMLAASALGTNVGDYASDLLGEGLVASAAPLALMSAAAILADRVWGRGGEVFFWLAIVILRAMATNLGDFLTGDLAFSRPAASLVLGAATLAAGWFTTAGRSPAIDARYWLAMALGGVFGTAAGDMVSHAIGLPLAAVGLSALVIAALSGRSALAPLAALGYWVIVLAERSAGTAIGDLIAEPRGLGLGLPVAMAVTAASLVLALAARAR